MLLSGLLLGWYLRPGPRAPAVLTGQSDLVPVTLGSLSLEVPANYIQNPAARAGGEQDSLDLAALFPVLAGLFAARCAAVPGQCARIPAVIRILLRGDANPWTPPRGWRASIGPILWRRKAWPALFGLRAIQLCRQFRLREERSVCRRQRPGPAAVTVRAAGGQTCPAPIAWPSTGRWRVVSAFPTASSAPIWRAGGKCRRASMR